MSRATIPAVKYRLRSGTATQTTPPVGLQPHPYIEKWISVVPGYNRVFKVHYKIAHFGTDSHAQNLQELPVAYVNPNIPHFLFYGGNAPSTHGVLTAFDVQGPCCDHVHTPEQWGAYVDATNTGLALYTPGQFPHSQVFNAGSTLQLTPLCPFSWSPGACAGISGSGWESSTRAGSPGSEWRVAGRRDLRTIGKFDARSTRRESYRAVNRKLLLSTCAP